MPRAGVVHVIYGSRDGLTRRDERFGQGFAGVPGTREPNQNFGAAVAAGDFDGDGRDDLAVGVPDDSVDGAEGAGSPQRRRRRLRRRGRLRPRRGAPFDGRSGSEDAGSVNVIHGHGNGLREDPDQLWSQGSAGIQGAVGTDNFGGAVAPN